MKSIVLFCLFPILSFCQVRFNNNYPCLNLVNQAGSIISLNDGYVFTEQISDSANVGIGIRKIDLNGNELWLKRYFIDKTQWYPGIGNSIQLINNRLIISCSFIDTIYTTLPSQGMIFALNMNGDSLWSKTYGGSWDDVFEGSISDSNGSIVSVGWYHTSATTYDAWAVKTDSLGNVIWDKKFGGTNGDIFNTVVLSPDGGYYLAGASNSFNTYDDAYLIKVDINGNLEWQKTFSSVYSDGISGVCIINNKLYLSGWSYPNYPQNSTGDGMLIICDLDGNFISRKTLGAKEIHQGFRANPIALTNGDIIIAGENCAHEINNAVWGWLYKFNENGDSIWARTYNFNPVVPNYIYDLKATADGGFIMAGSTHSGPVSGGQDAWVLKVDEYGCDTANCNIYDVVEEVKTTPIALSATPNPFSNETTISYRLNSNVQQAEIRIIEMATGKVVKTIVVNDNSAQNYLLESSFMSAGIYAVQLFANQVLVNTIKVVNIK